MSSPASVVLIHPHIALPGGARAQALLVVDGVIRAVGTRAEVRGAAQAGAAEVELPGAIVVAGFHDAHLHLAHMAREHDAVDLRAARSLDEALAAIAAHAAGRAAGRAWITGGRWDANRWGSGGRPTRQALDAVSSTTPVCLSSIDGHTVWANTAALRAVGIDADTPDPVGGRIEREPGTAEPSGLVREAAVAVLTAAAERSADLDIVAAVERAQHELLAAGITHITDYDGADSGAAIGRLHREHRLAVRVHKGMAMDGLDAAIAAGRKSYRGDAWVTSGPVKLFSDGALGSHTAHMSQDFADDPGNRGVEVLDAARLDDLVGRAVRAGIAVATHAIGDAANTAVLDAYERWMPQARAAGLRLRIEHAQLLRPVDARRFAALGVIASQQPSHWASDRPLIERMLPGRDLVGYGWSRLRADGARIAFGSDAPVEPITPLRGIQAAVQRSDAAGPIGAVPPFGVAEALAAYTEGSAYAAGLEERVGRIEPGMLADLTMLAEDPFTTPVGDIERIGVAATVVGGVVAYRADGV
ncbi:amidohydrolase [Microbacterium sp.]|uniref:amidohydrolase n=1 Tax=Microbacterium sp. TaxID=51671 RepID=UPI003A925232